MLRKGLLVVMSLTLSCGVVAQEEAEDEGPWSGSLSLGYLSTSGNTDTETGALKFDIAYSVNDWVHSFALRGNGAKESGSTTAEAYTAGWRSAYEFSEHNFVFGTVDWRKDRFAGVTEQLSYAINYGRRVINRPDHILGLAVGVGYRDSDRQDGTNETSAIGRGTLDYDWIWSETSNFQQDIVIESGSDNTYIESISAVRARLIGDFALVLSYTIRHNTDVPVGSEETDRISAVSVEYAF